MNNRLFLYSALFFVIILLTDAWDQDYSVDETRPAQVISEIPETKKNSKKTINSPPSKQQEQKTKKENLIFVDTNVLKLSINLVDGSIYSAELLDYPAANPQDKNKIKLLDNKNKKYVVRSGLQNISKQKVKNFTTGATRYSINDKETLLIVLNTSIDKEIKIKKTFKFKKDSYLINVSQEIINNSEEPVLWRQFLALERAEPIDSEGLLYTYTGPAYYDQEEKFNKITFDEIKESEPVKNISSGWISMIEHYFISAWIPSADKDIKASQVIYTKYNKKEIGQNYLIGYVSDYVEVNKKKKYIFNNKLYVGPKEQNKLEQAAEGLILTVDYGALTFIAAPLFWILENIFYFSGNWGVAIIILTLIIKLLFFKLSETSYRSMAKMKKLNPRMQALKERFGEDKKKFSEALMEMYKEEKVNPLGGCLPILIQIPVFIALYWVLIESVELRQANFAGWIDDLSSYDPFFVLPIAMGVSMYVQQKLNPAPTDATQQKIFMVMPFIFTFLFATFPSGLVLYWLTNNILSIAQQSVINKRIMSS